MGTISVFTISSPTLSLISMCAAVIFFVVVANFPLLLTSSKPTMVKIFSLLVMGVVIIGTISNKNKEYAVDHNSSILSRQGYVLSDTLSFSTILEKHYKMSEEGNVSNEHRYPYQALSTFFEQCSQGAGIVTDSQHNAIFTVNGMEDISPLKEKTPRTEKIHIYCKNSKAS